MSALGPVRAGSSCSWPSTSSSRTYPNVAANLERLIDISPGKKQYWVQLAAVQNHLQQDAKSAGDLAPRGSRRPPARRPGFPPARAPALRARPALSMRPGDRPGDLRRHREGRRRLVSDAVELLHRRSRERARARAARQGGRARAGRRDVHVARTDAPPARALRPRARGAAQGACQGEARAARIGPAPDRRGAARRQALRRRRARVPGRGQRCESRRGGAEATSSTWRSSAVASSSTTGTDSPRRSPGADRFLHPSFTAS